MAEYRPPLFQAMDWLSQRNAQNNQYYKNAPPVGTNMTPQQLRYAMPPMRDSQVEPTIDRIAQQGMPSYPPVSGEEIMKQLIAANAARPSNGSVSDARAQEIATANSTTNNPYLLNPKSGAAAMADPNAMTPALVNGRMPGASAGGGKGGGQMYGPTMADMPNGGQPTYYYMDPGDGGIVRTILSQNGMAPNMSGYTVAGSQLVPQDQGILAKLLRGAF